MEIIKDGNEKWIRPQYGNYLTQVSATKDEDRLLVLQVKVDSVSSADEWMEIDAEEAERIRKVKAAHGEVSYPEKEVSQTLMLMSMQINTMALSDSDALKVKDLYPAWEGFIGKELKTGMRVLYGERLYNVRQDVSVVLDNQPPSVETAALYEEVCEAHAGTLEDPIPYNNNMALEEGKYYAQDGVIYHCTRSTGQAVYNALKDLVGTYVEAV